MKRSSRLALLAALSGGAVVLSCEQEQPTPKAALNRPAGFAQIVRTGTTIRTDVFIADSEANAVRVLQIADRGEFFTPGAGQFVRAPAGHFPLAIPAPGYPTRVAASEDGQVVYVLSQLSRTIHVVDSRQTLLKLGSTALEWDSLVPLAELSLENLGGGPASVPIDIVTLPRRGGRDVVAVAFDDPGAPHGYVSAITFARTSTEGVRALFVETATVAPAPRNMVVRTVEPRAVLLSSARPASASVSMLPLQGESEARIFGPLTGLPAGGPTGAVVDAGRSGVVALRSDVAAAVVYDLIGGVLARAERDLGSPFTPLAIRGTPEGRGIAYLDPNPLVSGTYARTKYLPNADVATKDASNAPQIPPPVYDSGDLVDDGDGPLLDVVAMMHSGAAISFLIGRPLRVPISTPARVASVDILGGVGVRVHECPDLSKRPPCRDSVAGASLAGTQVVSAVWRGPLKTSSQGALARGSSAGGEVTYTLTDRGRRSFVPFRVRAGDQALIQLRAKRRGACGTMDPYVDFVATATVTAVADEELTLAITSSEAINQAESCLDTSGPLPVAEYELFPAGAEVVVVSRDSAGIAEVIDRIPTTTTATTVRVESRVRFTLVVDGGPSCRIASNVGGQCTTRNGCTGGRCGDVTDAGYGVCAVSCAPEDPSCLAAPLERTCSGATFAIAAARGNRVSLGLVDENVNYAPAIPDTIQWIEDAHGFLISLPGSRSMMVVQPTSSAGYRRVFL